MWQVIEPVALVLVWPIDKPSPSSPLVAFDCSEVVVGGGDEEETLWSLGHPFKEEAFEIFVVSGDDFALSMGETTPPRAGVVDIEMVDEVVVVQKDALFVIVGRRG